MGTLSGRQITPSQLDMIQVESHTHPIWKTYCGSWQSMYLKVSFWLSLLSMPPSMSGSNAEFTDPFSPPTLTQPPHKPLHSISMEGKVHHRLVSQFLVLLSEQGGREMKGVPSFMAFDSGQKRWWVSGDFFLLLFTFIILHLQVAAVNNNTLRFNTLRLGWGGSVLGVLKGLILHSWD